MPSSDDECARLMLETFPLAMHGLALEVRAMQYTLPQFRLLGYLHHHGPDSMGRLADWHNVTLPTMTKIVAGLVERGLVERTADPHDRRVVRLQLTTAGAELFKELHTRMETRLAGMVSAMRPADREALAAGLLGLQSAMRAATAEPAAGER
jgi:DNA-binding MarR family transcriptional regulator